MKRLSTLFLRPYSPMSRSMPLIGELACLEVKMFGKRYAVDLYVRFDEGEQATSTGSGQLIYPRPSRWPRITGGTVLTLSAYLH
jgi:hypothetical protein